MPTWMIVVVSVVAIHFLFIGMAKAGLVSVDKVGRISFS